MMQLLLLLLLVVLVGGARGSCPHSCQCSGDYLEVQCINASLEIVPLTLHPEIRSLVLNFNKISEVGPASFQFHPELRTVNLQSSGLQNLQDKTFEAQRRLTHLNLSHNEVRVLRELTFYGLWSLEELDLSHNQLEHLGAGVFAHMPNLTRLNLASNRVGLVEVSAFTGLGSLHTLRLEGNIVETVAEQAWETLPNLRELSLAENRINQLSLRYLTSLETLDISDNPWANLSSLSLPPVNSLRFVNLSKLGLESVPTPLFSAAPYLERILLNGNNFSRISNHAFSGLKRLKYLEIMENQKLSSIESAALSEARSLVSLNISGNSLLSWLDPDTLSQLASLQELSLQRNRFSSLVLNLGPTVRYLELTDNPWECDCDLRELQSLLLLRNQSGAVVCAGPEQLTGLDLLYLDLSSCNSTQGFSVPSSLGREIIMMIVLSVVLTTLLCLAAFLIYAFRARFQSLLKTISLRKPEAKASQYSPEYQRSFIQHDDYFISLSRQNEQARHIPVTEL